MALELLFESFSPKIKPPLFKVRNDINKGCKNSSQPRYSSSYHGRLKFIVIIIGFGQIQFEKEVAL